MTPTITLDPSGPWAKLRRRECVYLAKKHGVTEVTEEWAKNDIVAVLSARGVVPPAMNGRNIGKNFDPRAWDTNVDIDIPVSAPTPIPQSKKADIGFNEMRAELKAAGVKLDRKWDKAAVKAEWEKLGKITP